MEVPGPEWAPKHKLQRVTIVVIYGDDGEATVTVTGGAETKRTSLWSYAETMTGSRQVLAVPDVVHHVTVAVHQDRPTSQDALRRSLMGGITWEKPELPL